MHLARRGRARECQRGQKSVESLGMRPSKPSHNNKNKRLTLEAQIPSISHSSTG